MCPLALQTLRRGTAGELTCQFAFEEGVGCVLSSMCGENTMRVLETNDITERAGCIVVGRSVGI